MLQTHPLVLFRNFRVFFLGRVISAVGDKFFTIALSWWVVSQGGTNSRLHLGILLAISTLPIILFGPFMGTLADRYNKKYCMMTADGARGLLIGGLAFLAYTGQLSLAVLYPVCFALYFFMPLFESSANSSIEALTDHEHLSTAAAVNSSVVQFSNILGAGLGGALLAFLGTTGAFTVNALSFGLSLLCLSCISTKVFHNTVEVKQSYFEQFKEVFSYLHKARAIASMLIVFGLINFFFTPLFLFIPMVVKDTLQASVSWVAIFEVTLACGAVLTSAALSFLPRGREHLRIFAGVLVIGLSLLSFALCQPRWLLACSLFFCGAGMALVNAAAFSLFQNEIPPGIRGRFFAVLTTVAYSVMPLSFALNGALAQFASLEKALLINAAGVIVLSFVIIKLPDPLQSQGSVQQEQPAKFLGEP